MVRGRELEGFGVGRRGQQKGRKMGGNYTITTGGRILVCS